MGKTKKEARVLAKKAKERLKNNSYKEYDKSEFGTHYLNNRRMTRAELERLKKLVEEIVASDEVVIDPLNKLICDNDKFQSFNETERLRYMLELSNIYISLSSSICAIN